MTETERSFATMSFMKREEQMTFADTRSDPRKCDVRGGLHAASFVACQESFRSTAQIESYEIASALSCCASVGRKRRPLESVLESKTLAAGVVRPKADQTTR